MIRHVRKIPGLMLAITAVVAISQSAFAQSIPGVTYTYLSNGELPSHLHPDSTGGELTDGIFPDVPFPGLHINHSGWVGTSDPAWGTIHGPHADNGRPQPSIRFDLGADYDLVFFTYLELLHHSAAVGNATRVTLWAYDENFSPIAHRSFSLQGVCAHNCRRGPAFNFRANGARYVDVQFFNGRGFCFQWNFLGEVRFLGPLSDPNDAPTCEVASGSVDAHIGQPFGTTITSSDPDGDALDITSTGLPPWATLSVGGIPSAPEVFIEGIPTIADVGSHLVEVTFTDPEGESSTCGVDLVVFNTAPECSPSPATQVVTPGNSVSLTINGTDLDPGDLLAMTHSALPPGATITTTPTGLGLDVRFDWAPLLAELGTHEVVINFMDLNGAEAECNFFVEVVNVPPNCDPFNDFIFAFPGDLVTHTVTGSDFNPGDLLTITGKSGFPSKTGATATLSPDVGATGLSPFSATINWIPTAQDAILRGGRNMKVTFADASGAIDSCVVSVIVRNRRPACSPGQLIISAHVGEPIHAVLTATDPDLGDELTVRLRAKKPPPGAVITQSGTGQVVDMILDWTPTIDQVGTHNFGFDFRDLAGNQTFCSIIVQVINRRPSCSPEHELFFANIGEPFDFGVLGDDPDIGDQLTIGHSVLPAWLFGPAIVTGSAPLVADFAGVPGVGDVGVHSVSVGFTDLNGLSAECSFDVEVVNRPPLCDLEVDTLLFPSSDAGFVFEETAEMGPVLIGGFERFIVTVGDTFNATFTGSDPDAGDQLLMTSSALPAGASMTPPSIPDGSSPASAVFSWTPTAADVVGNPHLVEVTFTDLNGATSTCAFEIEVNQPPVAVCSASAALVISVIDNMVTVECDDFDGALVALDGSASIDPDGDPLTYQWSVSDYDVILDDEASPTPFGVFPPDSVVMATLTVADGRGGIDMCKVILRVVDTTPPQSMCTTSVAGLWPPRHDMLEVTVIIEATDDCTNPDFVFPIHVQVRSDEPDNADGVGDGNTTGDVNGQDGFTTPVVLATPDDFGIFTWNAAANPPRWEGTILLRAERDGTGDGRKYMIEATAFDMSMNASIMSCVVVVPHDQRGKKK